MSITAHYLCFDLANLILGVACNEYPNPNPVIDNWCRKLASQPQTPSISGINTSAPLHMLRFFRFRSQSSVWRAR
jgi:hypothetical protein